VKMTKMRYTASRYLPAVKLPEELRDGEFHLWSRGEEVE